MRGLPADKGILDFPFSILHWPVRIMDILHLVVLAFERGEPVSVLFGSARLL